MDKNHVSIIDDLPAILRDGLAGQLDLLLDVVVYHVTEELLGLEGAKMKSVLQVKLGKETGHLRQCRSCLVGLEIF